MRTRFAGTVSDYLDQGVMYGDHFQRVGSFWCYRILWVDFETEEVCGQRRFWYSLWNWLAA